MFFSIPKFNLKSWVIPPLFLKIFPPFGFPHPKIFFQVPPFLKFSTFGSPPFERVGEHTMITLFLPCPALIIHFNHFIFECPVLFSLLFPVPRPFLSHTFFLWVIRSEQFDRRIICLHNLLKVFIYIYYVF